MKEQTRNTEVQINEEELGKLSEKEFRIMIVKMIKNLESKMEKMQESINKDKNKNSAQISPDTKLTQTTGSILGGQKPKRRNNSTLKPGKRRPQTQ